MSYVVCADELRERLKGFRFATDGDVHEQQNWVLLKERFSNCERFWREFVVPLTRRIELPRGHPEWFGQRDVADDLRSVGFLHYSAFLHLAHAYAHLRRSEEESSFGDFYSHLGSACDLADDFLLKVYLLACQCRGRGSPLLQGLTKEQFLERAAAWYEKRYAKTYERYLCKGKPMPIYLPGRQDVLCEYLGEQAWKAYEKVSRPLREYRNVIMHDVAMGALLSSNEIHIVPKKERIQDYRGLTPVLNAASNFELQRKDFIVMQEEMIKDIAGLELALNTLWTYPLRTLSELLWEERNMALATKYNLTFE